MTQKLRALAYEFVDSSQPGKPWSRWFDRFLIVLIIANVAAVVLETVEQLHIDYGAYFYTFELISVAIFTVEYVFRLWTIVESPDGNYKSPVTGRIRYALSPLALIDLLAILPFYLAFILGVDLRFMRVFRLLRLLKLTRYSSAMHSLGSALYAQRKALLAALLLVLTMLVFASSFIYLVENEAQPEAFASIPHAMWWGLATLTTVGYGDIYPITAGGKLFGALIMILGVAMFALPAGILASGFAEEMRKQDFVVNWRMVANVPLFSFLDAAKIGEITDLLELERVPANFQIITKGDPADALYFVHQGEVEVQLSSGPARLGVGSFFGEIALLKDCTRTATVTSVCQSQLMLLSVKDFQALLRSNPDIQIALNDVMESRLKELEAAN